MNAALPRIALFTLGGTIASVPTKTGQEAVPKLSADALIEAVPQLVDFAQIEATTFTQRPSGDIDFALLVDLAAAIREAFAAGADGAVVTQGTDTLEESAYLLDLLTDEEKPIVITGAMRNSGLAGPDGPANLLAAVQVAASPLAHGLGPIAVFADQIHLARYVQKTHSAFIDAFRSPGLGPIGWIAENTVRIPVVPRRRTAPIPVTEAQIGALPRVALVKVGMEDDLQLLDGLDGRGYDAVVIESMGGGHVPGPDVPLVADLAQRIPVVFVTRTDAGPVYSATYGFPGSEKDLLDRGLIAGGAIDGSKARLLVRLMLAAGASRDDLARRLRDEAV